MPLRPPAGFIRPGFDPLKNPNAPTAVSASAGEASASVTFTPPANVGGSAISAYFAVSNPGQVTGTGASSPVSVTGLTNGTPYTFQVWALNTYGPGPFSAASGSVTPSLPPQMLIGGGTISQFNKTNVIQFLNFASTGNTIDFGDLTERRGGLASCSSATRGVFIAGADSSDNNTNVIDYVTIATRGNAIDFGDTGVTTDRATACSNQTYGVFILGGQTAYYITIATTGNSATFGSLIATHNNGSACSSTTRGLFSGGNQDTNIIEYITISTSGSGTDFGDLTQIGSYMSGGCSSNTRGLFGIGTSVSTITNVINYVTIASTGNAIDFGDLTLARGDAYGGASSNKTLGVFSGGYNSSFAPLNVIDYVTIASTGNATDFGDLITGLYALSACSSSHGGLA
jgi:hypothetical protein